MFSPKKRKADNAPPTKPRHSAITKKIMQVFMEASGRDKMMIPASFYQDLAALMEEYIIPGIRAEVERELYHYKAQRAMTWQAAAAQSQQAQAEARMREMMGMGAHTYWGSQAYTTQFPADCEMQLPDEAPSMPVPASSVEVRCYICGQAFKQKREWADRFTQESNERFKACEMDFPVVCPYCNNTLDWSEYNEYISEDGNDESDKA